MSTVKRFERLSIEEYFKLEERQEQRHEYVNGVIYAMVGGTARHNQIATAITAGLRQHLRDRSCTVFMSDMKVRVDEVFYYPDIMVVCKTVDPKSLHQSEPVVLVEVLSESTESKDRLEKLDAYQSLPSLEEYVLVAQDKVRVDIYRRTENTWQLETISYGDEFQLKSLAFTVPVEALYEDVIRNL